MPDHETNAAPVRLGERYLIEHGSFYLIQKTRKGEEELKPLTNWTAKIVGDRVRDDGSSQRREIVLQASLGGNDAEFAVSPDDFEMMKWVTRELGPKARIEPGYNYRDHIRCAIQLNSGCVVERRLYEHTGWIRWNGKWIYLHAGGYIGDVAGPVGPVGPTNAESVPEVELERDLSLFSLPAPATTRDQLTLAVNSVWAFLDAARPLLTFTLLAAVLRATIGENQLTLFLEGDSGRLKSALAVVAQQFFGAGLTEEHVPGSWVSSGNSLEVTAYILKDSLFLIDDFSPTGTSAEVSRLHKDAERVIRAKGNQQGRARCTSSGGLRAARVPRALLLMTGEDIPNGKSLRARMMTIEVHEGDIDGQELKVCQRAAKDGLLATFLATWIQWLAPRRDQVLKELAECQDRWKGSGDLDGMHRRTFMAKRELGFAFGKFMDFLRDEQLADENQLLYLESNSGFNLETLAFGQQQHVADVDVVDQFISVLSAAFVARMIHLEDCHVPGPPEKAPQLWGYILRTFYVKDKGDEDDGADEEDEADEKDKTKEKDKWIERKEWIPCGRRVGWVDEEFAYFDPLLMFSVLRKVSQEQGKSFPLTDHILRKRLVERGLAIPDAARQKNLRRITVDGERRDVLQIDVCKLRDLIHKPNSFANQDGLSLDDLLDA